MQEMEDHRTGRLDHGNRSVSLFYSLFLEETQVGDYSNSQKQVINAFMDDQHLDGGALHILKLIKF